MSCAPNSEDEMRAISKRAKTTKTGRGNKNLQTQKINKNEKKSRKGCSLRGDLPRQNERVLNSIDLFYVSIC